MEYTGVSCYGSVLTIDPLLLFILYVYTYKGWKIKTGLNEEKAFAVYNKLNANYPFPSWIKTPSAITKTSDHFKKDLYPKTWAEFECRCQELLNALAYLSMRNNCLDHIIYLEKWHLDFKTKQRYSRYTRVMHEQMRHLWDRIYWWNNQNYEERMVQAIMAANSLFGM